MNSLKYLKKAAERGSKLGLERITELCRKLGDPQNSTKVIHIAGTNGKGSFGTMLSAILCEAGYTVGSFSSPALTDVTDSFRINGETIALAEFKTVLNDLIPFCEDMTDKPTEFEVLTAAAYEIFKRKECDIALIECGMGGDTDSTNVIEQPLLSVITNIAVDHAAFLGSSIKEIARHKSGIIKPERPVLYGGNSSEAYEVISAAAAKNNSRLTLSDHSALEVISRDIHKTIFRHERFDVLESHMLGTYQSFNLANVLTAAEILRNEGLEIPECAIRTGIFKARQHGRFEVVSDKPLIIFDGAHNPDGIISAVKSIETYINGRVVLLIGVMADKEYKLYPELLGKFTDTAFTAAPDNPRSLDSTSLAEAFKLNGINAIPCGSVAEGVKKSVQYAKKYNLPLIAMGSLYMYKEFSSALYQIS